VPTPKNNFGAHAQNIHVQSWWRIFGKKRKNNNILNKIMISISILFNDDDDDPFKLFK
jgi:hypothetical protein